MASLKNLTIQQIRQIHDQLERYFFNEGNNVALRKVLQSKIGQTFKKKTDQAIRKQLLSVAELDKIIPIVNSVKKQDADLYEDITNHWVSFVDAFPGGKLGILAFLSFVADQGGQAGLDKLVPQYNFELRNEKLVNAVENRLEFLVESVDKTGLDWIVKRIDIWAKQGLTATEIVKLLRQEIPSTAESRSDLITETEAMYTMNQMEMEVYKRNKISQVIWKTSEDERVCEEYCVPNEMAGKIELGKEFPSGQTHPPSHILCRCFLLPVLPQYLEGEVWTGE